MVNRLHALNIFKFLMSILVIIIHTAPFNGNESLYGYIINQGLTRIAVPFFFIASGFFLYKKILRNELKNWILKILKLYVPWSIFYLIITNVSFSTLLKTGTLVISLDDLLFNILFGYWHLWFLPALIIAGVFVWLLSTIGTFRLIFIALTIYFLSCLLWYGFFYGNETAYNIVKNIFYLRSGLFFGFPFVCIGYLIAKNINLIENINKKTS